MRLLGWGLSAAGLAAAGTIALAAISLGGAASAQVSPEDGQSRGERYRELLAGELGISVEALTEAHVAARDKLIDELAAEGKITAEQAERMKAMEPGEGLYPGFGKHGVGHRLHSAVVSIFETAAEVVGLEVDVLRERLAGGESLADIAEAQGIDEETLKNELVEAITERINQAVEDGDIGQERADMLLEHIDELVGRAIGLESPFEGRFHFGGPRFEHMERHRN